MNDVSVFDLIMYNIPLVALVLMFVVPFGMLANATYKAVYKVKKVPTLQAILHFIPFYNYIMIRKYLYNNAIPVAIPSILAGLCIIFRLVVYIALPTNLWLLMVSVWVMIAGLALWYLTMAFTAAYTAVMTRRNVLTIIIGTIIPFFGAYIVSRNICKFFDQELYKDSEFDPNKS